MQTTTAEFDGTRFLVTQKGGHRTYITPQSRVSFQSGHVNGTITVNWTTAATFRLPASHSAMTMSLLAKRKERLRLVAAADDADAVPAGRARVKL